MFVEWTSLTTIYLTMQVRILTRRNKSIQQPNQLHRIVLLLERLTCNKFIKSIYKLSLREKVYSQTYFPRKVW